MPNYDLRRIPLNALTNQEANYWPLSRQPAVIFMVAKTLVARCRCCEANGSCENEFNRLSLGFIICVNDRCTFFRASLVILMVILVPDFYATPCNWMQVL